jgi:hypothetical protein
LKKLFSIGVTIYATAYIVAESEEEAQNIASHLPDSSGEMPTGYFGDDIEISGERFNPDMPELSFSPAMTVGPVEGAVDLVEEFEDEPEECGQCEGTGTTQSASNGEDEQCPVCDGSGEIS